MDQSTKEQGKTMAIISYITVIGLLIAYFSTRGDKENEFVSFHIGQSLRVFILGIIISVSIGIIISVTGLSILRFLSYAPLVFMVLGVMNANNLKDEKLPIIGDIG
ncbi:hypothetical protein CLV91_2023 [Maribacter vaceletii]|uniref:Uncharacterized protein n=1 Tax=Maribacter vaceletii TaxID=1206816 RepID=A0A495E923_9FLAO|nr:DUF4870 domain-containing protein [Maribacter vaceletii]RKR13306.1 hypothetical protein CLV91_2023 [Maribacter vaceletii]